MKTKLVVFLVLFAALGGSAFGQGIRFDSQVSQELLTTAVPGATNVLTVPASPQIAFCNFPANAVPCTNKTTTFTTNTLGTPCSTSTQIVLVNTTSCVASPDAQNNWGIWVPAGQYAYTITLPGGTNLGPYNVTLGAPNGTSVSFSVIDGIRYVDGTTFPTAQASIANCPATDCWVQVQPGTQAVPNNLNRSHLHLSCYTQGIPAATITAATNLVWGTPPADNKCIFTNTVNLTLSGIWDTTIEGFTFDFGGNNAGIVLQNGAFNNYFINDTIQNCGTGTCMTWSGGAVAGQSVVGNYFPGLKVFNAGKAIRMTATAPGVAANNTVSDFVFNNISSIGFECVQQADTNTLRNGFIYGLGNNATGVLINSATPAVDSGCNDNKILDITTDVLNGGGAYVGTLVQINKSNGTIVDPWSIGGSTNSGTELATTGSPSARVCTASDFSVASNSNWCRFLGPTQFGTGGSSINKIFLGSGTLTYTAIAAQTCQEQALAVTGATANTGVWSTSPNPGLGNVNLSWSAHADAIANSVLVRVCNPTVGAITPTAVSWTVSGMQ